jgi:molecular chaperone Hsp33
MSTKDSVVPFVFESLPVRGALIELSASWQRMLEDHDYDVLIRETLGHAAAATGLIAQSLKFDGGVTLQIQGEGALRMLVMQCTSELELRGMATPNPDVPANEFADIAHVAHCAITVDSGERPYQGIVEINRDSLSASLENYFERSVQVPSHVALVSNDDKACGLLLQQMPGADAIDVDDWNRLGFIADTLSLDDFSSEAGIELLRKLFAEDDVRVFSSKPVRFNCRCSTDRAEQVLRMLGAQELREAIDAMGIVELICEYCGRRRNFDSVDVTRLFADNVVTGPNSVQ